MTVVNTLRRLKIKGLAGTNSIHELSVGVVVDVYFQLSEKWDHHIIDGEAKKIERKI